MIIENVSVALESYIIIGSVLVGICGAACWGEIRKVWKEGK